MALKGAHPGRFTPKCPACQGRFLLVIPADANAAPTAEAIQVAKPAALTAAATQAPRATVAATAIGQTTAPAAATMPPKPKHEAGLQGSPGDLPQAPRTILKEDYPSAGPELTGTLGGYEILEKLGEGGMGAVYLARQVSLDRQVALKVLSPELAADPEFVARFTREAYAAAQLSHHNVVQIHDIGFDRDINFFSMEFVPGKTLEKLVHGDGKLDPEVAVGYVLQAARGLRFAHDHGLIHRDVKPDNLLLNEQGIVKVADLGLVKQANKPETSTKAGATKAAAAALVAPASASIGKTQLNISMGTPAYMPPEQARDAAHVDQRADIYSLGCTLYDLLTGRPPFDGKTAFEVITKHQKEAITPPERIARHVSHDLSALVMKMMAKKPEDRFQTMASVVESLEAILGVESGKPFSPKDEHVDLLEKSVEQFNGAKSAMLRKNLALAFFALCGVGAVICAIPQLGHYLIAGGLVGFAVLTFVFYQALVGVTRKTHLFTRVRQFMFGARIADWLKILATAAVVVLLLIAFDLHWVWLGFAVAAAAVAAGFHFTLDRLAEKERKSPIDNVETMLKTMRLRGLDETGLRQFVCKYSGQRWEELYEALFGYEAKRAARRSWGRDERSRNRKKHGAWRDAVIDWIDRRTIARREERERKLLAKLEAKALTAKGLDGASANRKAKQAADRMMSKASELKASSDQRAMMTAIPTGKNTMFAGAKSLASWADGFDAGTDDGKKHVSDVEDRKHESYFKRRFGSPLDFIVGPQVRILLGGILICAFALWVHQNRGGVVTNSVSVAKDSQIDDSVESRVKQGAAALKQVVDVRESKELFLPLVPKDIRQIAGSYNGGIAGALLVLSAFFTGKRMAICVLAGAGIILLAHRAGLPVIEGQPLIAAGAGVALGIVGVVMFRRTNND
jgi:serine/threonine protein kinase